MSFSDEPEPRLSQTAIDHAGQIKRNLHNLTTTGEPAERLTIIKNIRGHAQLLLAEATRTIEDYHEHVEQAAGLRLRDRVHKIYGAAGFAPWKTMSDSERGQWVSAAKDLGIEPPTATPTA